MTDRILHVIHSLNVGGQERIVVDLAKGFKRKGYSVSICCLGGKEPLGEEAKLAGIEVFSLNKKPGVAWTLPFYLSRRIRATGFDIIHTHNEAGLLYGATAALLARVSNIIHTEHGKEPGYSEKTRLRMVERFLLKRVKRVVTVSEDLKETICKASGVNGNRALVIHNGIDIEKYFRPEYREETRRVLGIAEERFVIGNIARLVPLKNHRFLLIIFNELRKQFSDLTLVIVGDGPIREDLEGYARELGLSNSVIFLGERKDVVELLSAFDLFILPSLTEGISITLLEAMAAGTPVIASEVGGNSEIIENEKTGLLIPLGDSSMWVEKIRSLKENDVKRIHSSKMARAVVSKKFSLKAMIENYRKIYKGNPICFRSCAKD